MLTSIQERQKRLDEEKQQVDTILGAYRSMAGLGSSEEKLTMLARIAELSERSAHGGSRRLRKRTAAELERQQEQAAALQAQPPPPQQQQQQQQQQLQQQQQQQQPQQGNRKKKQAATTAVSSIPLPPPVVHMLRLQEIEDDLANIRRLVVSMKAGSGARRKERT
jgi:transcription initiation factor TFIID subunit TAF12